MSVCPTPTWAELHPPLPQYAGKVNLCAGCAAEGGHTEAQFDAQDRVVNGIIFMIRGFLCDRHQSYMGNHPAEHRHVTD